MGRIPGQVPNKERLDLIREVSRTGKRSRIDDHGATPRPTVASVVQGLGLDRARESQWSRLIQDIATPTATSIAVRKAVIAKLLEDKADPELKRALLQRTLRYHRDLKKSFVEEELWKAGPFIGPRGGKWADAKHTIPWKEEKTKGPKLVLDPGKTKQKAPVHTPTGRYQYGLAFRPPGMGTLPEGEFTHEKHADFRHGVVTFDRPLTTKEIKSFELIPLLSAKEIATRVDRAVAEVLSEYPEEQRELAEEDPRYFAMAARQALVDQGPGHLPDIDGLAETIRQKVLAGGKEKPPADSTLPKTIKVRFHGNLYSRGKEDQVVDYHVVATKGDKVQLSPHGPESTFGPWMPKASVKHFVNDMAGRVDVPPDSGNAAIDAVSSGRAKFLGKGDDGLAFKVGKQVVKVSTTVPFQPDNPGHRTPEGAVEMLRGQAELGNKLADLGVKGIQRSEFIVHGDKGFQIKPWVEIPKKFTRVQLDAIQDIVIAVHEKGYSINNSVQAGLDDEGDPILFDVGKAAKIEVTEGMYSDVETDMDNLRSLYGDHGEPFVRRDVDEAEQMWQRVTAETIPRALKAERWTQAEKWLERAADKKRDQLKATLKGKDLEEELEILEDFIVADVQFDIDRARKKAEGAGETKKSRVSSADLEDLVKAAGHKYLRRIPSKRKGRKWDYVYAARSQHHDTSFQVGEKIRLPHGPQAGHYEVESLHGPYVTVKHDETGHEVTIHKDKLAEMFRDEHQGAGGRRAGETKAGREERRKQAREKAKGAYAATERANRIKDKASHQKAAGAHTAAADAGAKNANLHRQLAEVHQRAVATHGAIERLAQEKMIRAPKLVIKLERKPPPDNLGTKAQSYRALMHELGDLPRDFHAKDLAYQRWRDGRGEKPAPWEGGELDSVNEALGYQKPSRHERLSGRTKDYRVSSAREAWDRLTVGITKWSDPKIEQAFEILRDVPGLEQIRIPQDALARVTVKGATKEQEEYYREKLAAQEAGSHEADPEELDVDPEVDTSFDFGWNVEEAHAKSLARLGNRLIYVRSLRKADPRGGTYHRRVPRPGGGYRYYYDAEQYERHPGRHVNGPEAKAQRTHKAVTAHIEAAGKQGAELKGLKGLVKGHGAEGLVVAVRRGLDAGDIVHRKGRLYHKSSAPAPKRKKMKAKGRKAQLKSKVA